MKLIYEEENLVEMSTIYYGNTENVGIAVNPDGGRIGDPYFKFYNNKSYSASTHLARIMFFKPEYAVHSGSKKPWNLNSKERKILVTVMNKESDYYDNATNWDAAKFDWNREALKLPIKISKYLQGEYDELYSDNPSYVPSYLKMPNYRNLE